MCRYPRGKQIYEQGESGDSMFRVVSGAVRLSTIREDGRQFMYLLFEPGDCFGASSCIDGGPRPHLAEAAEESVLQLLGKASFDRIRAAHRAFDDALLRLMSGDMRLLSGFLADAHLSDLTARVAGRILSMARSFGVAEAGGTVLSVRMTQTDLALMVGGARQSVNRVLQHFEEEGVVEVRGGRLSIRNFDALRLKVTEQGGDVTWVTAPLGTG